MRPARSRKHITFKNSAIAVAMAAIFIAIISYFGWNWPYSDPSVSPLIYSSTVAGLNGEFGETFGIATRSGTIFVSDGEKGQILQLNQDKVAVFAAGLNTPSGIAFDTKGNLIVADAGSNSIKSINEKGEVTTLAGSDGKSGMIDGDVSVALFRSPVGVAVDKDGRIFVADTYNDRVRVIDNGKVSTLAGSTRGFADGAGASAKFDTPTGIAIWKDKLLVADSGNRRIRVVEADGNVWTLAGNGDENLKDGLLSMSSFVEPTAIAVNKNEIFVADGNAIRMISGDIFATVTTINSGDRGFADGNVRRARFNRPSGLAIENNGDLLIADAENRVVRRISSSPTGATASAEQIASMNETAEQFRALQPGRWPYDPPLAKRDIAGTLGELRGEVKSGNDQIWFHNGLDIAGAYGETARFIRDEKVLRPQAANNFGTLRELIRMPTLGYIHIRLGRSSDETPFGDTRFLFQKEASGKFVDVRIPRGAFFRAGEPIGTLNSMNHVHLVAGRSGSEMNALDALVLPGISDSRPPTIEEISLIDENSRQLETKSSAGRIQVAGKVRIVMRAYDQVDGNSERRRLGLYRAGYQLLNADGSPLSDVKWQITFDRLPDSAAVPLVYAEGSKSGATGETIFGYIVTDRVQAPIFEQGFVDSAMLDKSNYVVRVFAADYFGNTSQKDIQIEVIK